MGELADAWSSQGVPNTWGAVPQVIEMQSEGGAAGAVPGRLQAGAPPTPFTPALRGGAQTPDVFSQSREAATAFYAGAPAVVQEEMTRLGARTGRPYRLFAYVGHPAAAAALVLM